MRLLFHACWAFFIANADAAGLDIRVIAADGSAIGGTVVVLRSVDPSRPVARPADAQIDQIDRRFVPQVLIVTTGSKITFPNSDTVRHQVYSFSPAKRFQLPLYRGTAYPPVVFDRAGIVTLGCNIHDRMRAYVFVVNGQYFGRTDVSGTWKSLDVEPGIYNVQIWHPLAREARPFIDQEISVVATMPRITLRSATPLRLRPESQVPANWDAY